MDFLQQILDSSDIPAVMAFVLGLLTAISPCPLATNITAIGYIGKNIGNRKRIFLSGILYTIGRMVAYSVLGAILIYLIRSGTDMFGIQKSVSKWDEMIIAPVLILIGLLMFLGNKLKIPQFGFSGNCGTNTQKGLWGSFVLGLLFAMAFCPTSGLFYFGMLIPMSAQATAGYFLPILFALATGLPVMFVAWILAYSVSSIGAFYNKIQLFQKWINIVVAVLFIVVGLYYAYVFYL